MKILDILKERHRTGKKSIAVLVDPDKADDSARLNQLINLASENCIDFFFVPANGSSTAAGKRSPAGVVVGSPGTCVRLHAVRCGRLPGCVGG